MVTAPGLALLKAVTVKRLVVNHAKAKTLGDGRGTLDHGAILSVVARPQPMQSAADHAPIVDPVRTRLIGRW